jgi:large subunit ribosomal protein L20
MVKALSYSYAHRRERKGDMRQLWITRVGAASRANGITYGQFMDGLKKAGVAINRKVLADMAIKEPAAFTELVTVARKQSES